MGGDAQEENCCTPVLAFLGFLLSPNETLRKGTSMPAASTTLPKKEKHEKQPRKVQSLLNIGPPVLRNTTFTLLDITIHLKNFAIACKLL